MPIRQLEPNTHFTLPFDLPRSRRTVDLFVESELPVRAFILDDHGLAAFRAGKRYETYGSNRASRRHEKRVRLPSGTWNLVIANPNDARAAIFYQMT
jgi:hypothetical protein